jgi:CelD/BcsL family acetyltransferase involved in cellulose biosynthesis
MHSERSIPAPAAVAMATPAARAARCLGVQCIAREESFIALGAEWERLHAASETSSVFNSWLVQHVWWQVYGRGRRLRVFVARDGGELVGILPLYLQRSSVAGIPVRRLRLVGTGVDTYPDDLGPVLSPCSRRAVLEALSRAVVDSAEWDVVELTDLDPRMGLHEALAGIVRSSKIPCAPGRSQRIAYVEIPSTWQAYLDSLSRERRGHLRRLRRRLDRALPWRFFVWDNERRIGEALERLADLHRRRWIASGTPSESFASPQYLEFHRRVMAGALQRGWLRLYCLELAGEVAAMIYAYRFRNRVYLMQAGFDPRHAHRSPGAVLLGCALEHAIGEGNAAFDFLRGEHAYKDELASGERETVFVKCYRNTARAMAWRLASEQLPALKARLRPLIAQRSG